MNIEQRIDRQLAVLDDKQKADLLNKHIGPVVHGEPDPKGDAIYLRDIVGRQIRDADAKEEALAKTGIAQLEQRVKVLESILGKDGQRLMGAMAKGTAQAFEHMIIERGCMRHLGTWDEEKVYGKGACVIQDGATWLAIAETAKAAKPGKALEWRLIAKGEKA